MTATNYSPKVDAYLGKTQPFAVPILEHLRDLMHKGCPGVEETIKWGMPFFEYGGVIFGNMAGFKKHCSFGFWGEEIGAVLKEAKAVQAGGMGTLGRIETIGDLPSDKLMLSWIKQAKAFIDKGQYTSSIAARQTVVKAPKATVEPPAAFKTALTKNKKAASVFATLSPSCRREYVEWIAAAKRAETRDKRIAEAVTWIAHGKQRNWKYQEC